MSALATKGIARRSGSRLDLALVVTGLSLGQRRFRRAFGFLLHGLRRLLGVRARFRKHSQKLRAGIGNHQEGSFFPYRIAGCLSFGSARIIEQLYAVVNKPDELASV